MKFAGLVEHCAAARRSLGRADQDDRANHRATASEFAYSDSQSEDQKAGVVRQLELCVTQLILYLRTIRRRYTVVHVKTKEYGAITNNPLRPRIFFSAFPSYRALNFFSI